MDGAISTLGAEREQLGAVMNRLDHTIANLDNIATNLALAKGRIEDADFARVRTLRGHKFYSRHRWQCLRKHKTEHTDVFQ